MLTSFKIALKVFKYLSILFTVVFWIYMIYDDCIFIEKYGLELEDIGSWFLWYLIYFLGFAFYFWVLCSAAILIYYKLIKAKRVR